MKKVTLTFADDAEAEAFARAARNPVIAAGGLSANWKVTFDSTPDLSQRSQGYDRLRSVTRVEVS